MEMGDEPAVRKRLGDDLATALDRVHHALQDSKYMFTVLEVCDQLGIDFRPSSGVAA